MRALKSEFKKMLKTLKKVSIPKKTMNYELLRKKRVKKYGNRILLELTDKTEKKLKFQSSSMFNARFTVNLYGHFNENLS